MRLQFNYNSGHKLTAPIIKKLSASLTGALFG
ncbi:hypothetical protein SME13J_02080 [Serratia marcescens]|nr:hypothetical protein SME13J_02080 [Serratia marcescens]